ncbi:MAG: aminopeptidase P family protein [Melioribacteraceae bacterium]|nr:aminopeptidase P family protein [Melioribacteraceae bacterium]
MFSEKTYSERRRQLKQLVKSGVIIFPGNKEVSFNYPANEYKFRQESSFLYYFGIDKSGLNAVIDIDEGREIIFGDDFSLDDMVWMGDLPKLADQAKLVGIKEVQSENALAEFVLSAVNSKRKVHYLPQYRHDSINLLESLLGINHTAINKYASNNLIKAVVAQRSIKSDEEVAEIENAIEISYVMNTYAMMATKPGIYEREISGVVEGIALSMGEGISFPIIYSVHGETLHNHYHGNLMQDGDIAVLDSGAESLLHYASDITRTIPVNGKFSEKQKAIYNSVLNASNTALSEIKPGVLFKDVHLKAVRTLAEGLKDLGIMKGDIDEAVKEGAHALFMPHGLGHMMGLDVHDMEGLGENFVGYNTEIKRSEQFGLAYLRLGRKLEPGFVLTVEPGCYFIPKLIEKWKSESKHIDFINYKELENYLDFGGVRIEDDVYVDFNGCRVLGKPIPKTVEDVENACEGILK